MQAHDAVAEGARPRGTQWAAGAGGVMCTYVCLDLLKGAGVRSHASRPLGLHGTAHTHARVGAPTTHNVRHSEALEAWMRQACTLVDGVQPGWGCALARGRRHGMACGAQAQASTWHMVNEGGRHLLRSSWDRADRRFSSSRPMGSPDVGSCSRAQGVQGSRAQLGARCCNRFRALPLPQDTTQPSARTQPRTCK
jgi:hypothetical protein